MPEPKTLLFDIETAPSLGFVWAKYQTDVIDFQKQWYILSFAHKWLGESKIHVSSLRDCKGYDDDRECDRNLVQELWKLIDQADVIIGHNSDRFDLRKANARFVAHGLPPPAPYKCVDTLKIAKKHFKFDSNRLDDLGKYLGVGRKLPHTGFHLWRGCMMGDPKSWKLMKKYNAQDVALLEKVYLKLRPWSSTHPRLTDFTKEHACPACLSNNVQHRGQEVTKTGHRQRFQCQDCSKWFSGLKHVKESSLG